MPELAGQHEAGADRPRPRPSQRPADPLGQDERCGGRDQQRLEADDQRRQAGLEPSRIATNTPPR